MRSQNLEYVGLDQVAAPASLSPSPPPCLHPSHSPPTPAPPSPIPSFLGLQVAARAVGRIGSCGGGPVRAALGGWGAEWLLRAAAMACKATLLVLPLLAAAQWGLRAARAGQRLRREGARQARSYRSAGFPLPPPSPTLPKAYARSYAWHTVVYARHVHACTLLGSQGEKARRIKMTNELLVPVLRRRCAAAVAMHVSMLLLVGLVGQYELNGINSELGTFLVLACAGGLRAPCRRAATPPLGTRASARQHAPARPAPLPPRGRLPLRVAALLVRPTRPRAPVHLLRHVHGGLSSI